MFLAETQDQTQEQLNDEERVCTICLDDIKLDEMIFDIKCKHVFHEACLKKWLRIQKLCPNCKKTITLEGWNLFYWPGFSK